MYFNENLLKKMTNAAQTNDLEVHFIQVLWKRDNIYQKRALFDQ